MSKWSSIWSSDRHTNLTVAVDTVECSRGFACHRNSLTISVTHKKSRRVLAERSTNLLNRFIQRLLDRVLDHLCMRVKEDFTYILYIVLCDAFHFIFKRRHCFQILLDKSRQNHKSWKSITCTQWYSSIIKVTSRQDITWCQMSRVNTDFDKMWEMNRVNVLHWNC